MNAAAKQRSQLGALEDSASRQRDFLSSAFRQGEFEVRTLQIFENVAVFLGDASPNPEAAENGLYELIPNGLEHGIARIEYEEKTRLLAAGTWEGELQRRLRDLAKKKEIQVSARDLGRASTGGRFSRSIRRARPDPTDAASPRRTC